MKRKRNRNIELELDNLSLDFFKATGMDIHFVYGGDGELLNKMREISNIQNSDMNSSETKSSIFYPIRNYGNCAEHDIGNIINTLKSGIKSVKNIKKDLRILMSDVPILAMRQYDYSLPVLIQNIASNEEYKAFSEIVIKSSNPTQCIRIDVSVNSKIVYKNAICDGIIVSTDLIGSHGYFKSVTRTTFKHGIGFAFINPTYGLTNCILSDMDALDIKFCRPCDVMITTDTQYFQQHISSLTTEYNIRLSIMDSGLVKIIDYPGFMCYKCRQNRNSTERINDYYV